MKPTQIHFLQFIIKHIQKIFNFRDYFSSRMFMEYFFKKKFKVLFYKFLCYCTWSGIIILRTYFVSCYVYIEV